MGEGLKRVAKLCGGITVKANGSTATYDRDSKPVNEKPVWELMECDAGNRYTQRKTSSEWHSKFLDKDGSTCHFQGCPKGDMAHKVHKVKETMDIKEASSWFRDVSEE